MNLSFQSPCLSLSSTCGFRCELYNAGFLFHHSVLLTDVTVFLCLIFSAILPSHHAGWAQGDDVRLQVLGLKQSTLLLYVMSWEMNIPLNFSVLACNFCPILKYFCGYDIMKIFKYNNAVWCFNSIGVTLCKKRRLCVGRRVRNDNSVIESSCILVKITWLSDPQFAYLELES